MTKEVASYALALAAAGLDGERPTQKHDRTWKNFIRSEFETALLAD